MFTHICKQNMLTALDHICRRLDAYSESVVPGDYYWIASSDIFHRALWTIRAWKNLKFVIISCPQFLMGCILHPCAHWTCHILHQEKLPTLCFWPQSLKSFTYLVSTENLPSPFPLRSDNLAVHSAWDSITTALCYDAQSTRTEEASTLKHTEKHKMPVRRRMRVLRADITRCLSVNTNIACFLKIPQSPNLTRYTLTRRWLAASAQWGALATNNWHLRIMQASAYSCSPRLEPTCSA